MINNENLKDASAYKCLKLISTVCDIIVVSFTILLPTRVISYVSMDNRNTDIIHNPNDNHNIQSDSIYTLCFMINIDEVQKTFKTLKEL